MKLLFPGRAPAITLLLFALVGCREFTTIDRSYQRLLINDFSTPVRSLLPPPGGNPHSIRLRVSGTISQPVTLTVNQITLDRQRSTARRDTLVAGTYADRNFGGDFYGNTETELIVTGAPGTTGSLTVKWAINSL